MGFEILANHGVDSHETEHAGLANAALCVVIALRRDEAASGTARTQTCTHIHTQQGSAGTWEEPQTVQSTRKHFQGQIRQIIPQCPNMNIVQICLFGADREVSALCVASNLCSPGYLRQKNKGQEFKNKNDVC